MEIILDYGVNISVVLLPSRSFQLSKECFIFCCSEDMEKQLNELLAQPSGEFKKFTRMSSYDFEYLLNKISSTISKEDTQLRKAIPARIRLAITLRYLATGDDYESLHFLFKVSPQIISQIIPEVCFALTKALKDEIKVNIFLYKIYLIPRHTHKT